MGVIKGTALVEGKEYPVEVDGVIFNSNKEDEFSYFIKPWYISVGSIHGMPIRSSMVGKKIKITLEDLCLFDKLAISGFSVSLMNRDDTKVHKVYTVPLSAIGKKQGEKIK